MDNNIECAELIKKAFELKEQKYYKPAIEMLYKALEIENNNIEILYQIGELYYLMNDFKRAISYIEKIYTINSNHIKSLNLEKNIRKKQGEYDSALNNAQKLCELEPNSENLKDLVEILLKLKKYSEIDAYKNNNYFNDDIRFTCAQSLYSNGEYEKAKEYIAQCNPDNENIIILNGKIKYDNKDYEGAKQIFNRLNANTPNPEVLNYLGLFQLENMNFTQAITYFSKASTIANNNPKYLYNLANAYFYNGWFEEAKNAYMKAIYLAPENLDYKYSLAYLYYDHKDYQKSEKENDSILNIDPKHKQARILKALLYAQQNKYIEAKEILENIIAENDTDDFANISLAKIYAELGIFEKAEYLFETTIKTNPENLDYRCELADILIKEKLYDKALDAVSHIIKLNPNYISGYILGAKANYLKQNFEMAKNFAQDALALDMNCAEAYYYLALARNGMNDNDEAIECMKRAILYDLNNPDYYAKMSDFYRKKDDYKSAFEYISEAESLDKTNKYKFKYSELAKLNRQK